MNALIDLLPLVVFWVVLKLTDIYQATMVLMGGYALVVVYHWLRQKRPPKMHLVTAAMIEIFGALTLYFRNPEFIKIKFSLAYILTAAAMLSSHFIGDKVLLARMTQGEINLPDKLWRRMSLAWISFFLLLAGVNFYIAENYSDGAWANFKLASVFLLHMYAKSSGDPAVAKLRV